KISINDLKNERQWRSATGLNKERYIKLLKLFDSSYQNTFGCTLPERQAQSPMDTVITSIEDLLFFTLFSLKCGLTFDLLGLVTGMDGSTANRNKVLGVSILQSALYNNGYAPARSFDTIEEFEKYFKEHSAVMIDATEIPIQRPINEYDQKANYSGKKKDIQ
ncbi:helix-turn-helix domain-containing protein, partial [Arundinibacter roseus]|uniref:hypothetical protein n=1 Tax=Arundinibacter roseus TaxID=2070510 RepID=UPI0018FE5B7B